MPRRIGRGAARVCFFGAQFRQAGEKDHLVAVAEHHGRRRGVDLIEAWRHADRLLGERDLAIGVIEIALPQQLKHATDAARELLDQPENVILPEHGAPDGYRTI